MKQLSTEDIENVENSSEKENRQPGKNTDCQACLNFRLENMARYGKLFSLGESQL